MHHVDTKRKHFHTRIIAILECRWLPTLKPRQPVSLAAHLLSCLGATQVFFRQIFKRELNSAWISHVWVIPLKNYMGDPQTGGLLGLSPCFLIQQLYFWSPSETLYFTGTRTRRPKSEVCFKPTESNFRRESPLFGMALRPVGKLSGVVSLVRVLVVNLRTFWCVVKLDFMVKQYWVLYGSIPLGNKGACIEQSFMSPAFHSWSNFLSWFHGFLRSTRKTDTALACL